MPKDPIERLRILKREVEILMAGIEFPDEYNHACYERVMDILENWEIEELKKVK